ncbi:uncharacterized protein LOC108096447 [Drosophila ficusphila]|uniref:uncharacterized protein LOC108096447 n=1 Tax=Drosophila ficusphila TaxID=30025 RepID=UPI001C8A2710|nr:uncharacterized protein LOC108096447 [Drosophila ficusphila]
MNANKRRSSLRRAPPKEDDQTTIAITKQQQIKRRISFSGKKSVREFVNTKETNNWDDSYEVSEHNAEDSSRSGSGSRSGSLPRATEDANKENVLFPGICEREESTLTLNLQTSLDVTMLPSEQLQNTRKTNSMCLSTEERRIMQSSIYDRRCMDKTMDLMSGTLVNRRQIPSSINEDTSFEMPPNQTEKRVDNPPVKAISDSFMDITPLGFVAPVSAAPVPAAPAPVAVIPAAVPASSATAYPPKQQSFMEMEEDSLVREMREFNEKDRKTPAQKSLFMDLEEVGKGLKNQTQHGDMNISFDCPLNVSEDRDPLPSSSLESNNCTIQYMKDESMLIPFDMISGKNISKKINFRQLNDELEAGKIQLFSNGPKTPTTDRKTKKNRFWRGLEHEDSSPKIDIRSIKPRATLNFSENMTMSPAQRSPVLKEKEKLKMPDDKQKYRLSQADELMLDNTNFLAHAKLGDETQSRNTSKNSTRRETTYDNSELHLEFPTSSQVLQSMPNLKSRQTVNLAEEMQQDHLDLPAASKGKSIANRRTMHLNESIDQEATRPMHLRKEISVTTEKISYEKVTFNEQNPNQKATVLACTKTKRRETLLMQESMEEDIISPLKELSLKTRAAPVEEKKVNPNNMLPFKKEIRPKARHTLLLEEPMEEETSNNVKDLPVCNSKRKTLHLAEPLEEEEINPNKNKIFANAGSKPRARQTILSADPMEEENGGNIKNQQLYTTKTKPRHTLLLEEPIETENNFESHAKSRQTLTEEEDPEVFANAGSKPRTRQTILFAEPMEEDTDCYIKNQQVNTTKTKPRNTLILEEPIETEKNFESRPKSRQMITEEQKTNLNKNKISGNEVSKRSRQTILLAEPIEEDTGSNIKNQQLYTNKTKSRNTLLLEEPIETEKNVESIDQPRAKSRQTLTTSERMEEEDVVTLQPKRKTIVQQKVIDRTNVPHSQKPRQTLTMSESIEEENPSPNLKELPRGKTRNTLMYAPIQDLEAEKENNPAGQQRLMPRQTLIMSEPIEEDVGQTEHKSFNNPESNIQTKKTASITSKSRHTLLMSEPIDDDFWEVKPVDQTKAPSSEVVSKSTTNNKSTKPRGTLWMCEPMEEEVHMTRTHQKRSEIVEEYSEDVPIENAGRPSNSRQTLLMAEPIEEEELQWTQPYKKAEVKKTEHSRKSRQTILMQEPIEEDIHNNLSRNTQMLEEPIDQVASNVNLKSSRHTLHNAVPIEEDVEIHKSMKNVKEKSLLNQKLEEPIKNELLSNADQVIGKRSSKSRQTLLLAEPIEEDTQPLYSANYQNDYHRQKPRNTLLTHEPIQEDLEAPKAVQLTGPLKSKARQTLIMAEPVEEDFSVYNNSTNYQNSKAFKNVTSNSRHTLLVPQPIEEENISDQHDVMTLPAESCKHKPRNTIVLTEPIAEDVDLRVKEISRKSRPNLVGTQPIDDGNISTMDQTLHKNNNMPPVPSSTRHTLHLSEPIEEDGEISKTKTPTKEQVSENLEKPKGFLQFLKKKMFNNFLQTEEKEEAVSKTHQNMIMSESMDYQSPEATKNDPDFDAITPLPNTRTISRIKQLSTYTPGMSLTEFENQEELCKTPVPKKMMVTSLRKKMSMYQPVQMELTANASVVGTPINHLKLKRSVTHLTPNLPESKKQHTNLFADSNMDMEMDDEEEGAWGTTNINLEAATNKSRRTFTVDPMDASVQPVRDYHPAMTELNKKSSLDMLELPRKSVYAVEDKPITISDVTDFFEKQKEEQRQSGSSSDRTFKSYAVTITKFLNLTGDTTMFAAAKDSDKEEMEQPYQIDKERLSLVSTLADETDDEVEEQVEEQVEPQPNPELCEGQKNSANIPGSSGTCKKCANCNQTMSETKLGDDSFFLPAQKCWDFSKERKRLQILRQKPTLKEVMLYFEIEEQARLSKFEESDDDSVDETKVEEEPFTWNKDCLLEQFKRRIGEQKLTTQPATSFFDRLKVLLYEQQPNWIFDFQRKISKQLIFYHRLLTTFRIVVNYKIEDVVEESAIQVVSIEVDNAVAIPKEHWSSREHFLDFQLSLYLPLNLTNAIEDSHESAFVKFLHQIDQSIVKIRQSFHELMTVLTDSRARLIRDAYHRTVVKKTVRKCIEGEPVVQLEKTNFLIEITNINEVSFRDILRPELHLFNENIQYLPKGIAFLKAFLTNPEQYLKT